MAIWVVILISLSISTLLIFFFSRKSHHNFPPGPPRIPIIGNLLWLRQSISKLEPILRSLHTKFGPILTLHAGPYSAIFIGDRFLAHQALIQNGTTFADRPPFIATNKVITNRPTSIVTSPYSPTWRVLRRNLAEFVLQPSRLKLRLNSLTLAMNMLLESLNDSQENQFNDKFRHAVFVLFVFMCFGDKLDRKKIEEIEYIQRRKLLNFGQFNVLNLWPRVAKIVFRKSWNELVQVRQKQEEILAPLIREKMNERVLKGSENGSILSYLDTLLDLHLPHGSRKLDEGEIISLCSEFLSAGPDTTSTALQWIMANVVKNPSIQEKLFMEIKGVVRDGDREVKEDALQGLDYLKAVILEGLRRHPPSHFLIPHSVAKDTKLGGYFIPKKGIVSFSVTEISWDPKVWEDPMTFNPERFVNNNGNGDEIFNIKGNKEIKMIPFGAGRRICPGYGLAMLALEYFVANLIWNFEWKAVDEEGVDLSEKQEFTVVMKNPLKAQITPRFM
ncbi:cytochrome P450 89A2-like [Tripterygium wilfordii]|uniref:Cytochrome P450 89A2-like n=1 Tax=Tripterygium wilfordii TaxID=458696 RepID=A0A7J7CNF0_TRIWF|nr:cytochrome P450 89A2-like [Tripterygium wilfordii]KAF5735436.1 cytochrome P450 89A2-like [Tripterygium wilfordii]